MKLGILGGTFDPVHLGHTALAGAAADAMSLDTVLFIPNACPPHKPGRRIAPYEDRVKMLRLALADCPVGELCEMETGADTPHYTVDTIRALKTARGEDAEYFLLLGSDEAADFSSWRDPEKILAEVTVAVAPRAGCDTGTIERSGDFCILDVEIPDISSTEIRKKAASKSGLEQLVRPAVADYLLTHNLYN
jgi:nicotinate-nucleotide adenylyltransferase